ncbi:MAG: Asp-tRNA(Asn)/Glu-tRNA(Gln) amidotransferase subunit GatA [Acidobacteriota bacterium]
MIHQLSIRELRDAITRKEFSITEVVQGFIDRIDQQEGKIRAFLSVSLESALAQARALDQKLAQGEIQNGLLTGIPVAIKDNIVTEGVATTCASRILENYIPPYDATVVRRLKEHGVIVLGKANCDEFAMGSSTENSAYFTTQNPWDLERVPGGSSGGSAAAVAAWEVPGALGSDTGGSIRQPAAFCGVVGLKPTYGRVSRYGLVAFASSLDQIGPLANNVEDVALLLQAIVGADDRDSTSVERPGEDYLEDLGKDVQGFKIGVPSEWFSSGLDPQIEQAVQASIQKLEGLGCSIQEVHLPHSEYAISTYYIIAPAEASSNLARYDGVKYGYRHPNAANLEDLFRSARSQGFGEEVKRRIMIGTYALSSGYYDAYFLKASKARTLLKNDYLEAFKEVDFLVGPTTPSLPFKMGEKKTDPLEMYLMDAYTVTANLAGIPGLAMPCGFSQEGLPIGLQIQAPHFEEAKLLRLAHALETELAVQRPTLAVDR